MKFAALIVAAGSGNRAGGGLPKQFRTLAGQSILARSINALLACSRIEQVVCVINESYKAEYLQSVVGIDDPRLKAPVTGQPKSRTESVKLGLSAVKSEKVLIHDSVRPFVPLDALDRLIDRLETSQAAYLAIPVVDALWDVQDGTAISARSRENLWRAQTPQAFQTADILAAHNNATQDADDDVQLMVDAGASVDVVLGSDRNIKITQPQDFALAERMLRGAMDIRTGQGYDVHAFTDGDHVTLCGVEIPHSHGFLAHSDGDVAMHAITDAIFGALAEGDIGQWFPPNDDQWKGAASEIFLIKACQRVSARGFAISNIDCTIICESPKIGPHSNTMRERLAQIIAIDIDRISIKATTSEKLGFTGRKEGIAAMATATLVSE